MFYFQVDKLRIERAERARAGASTPPSPLAPSEPFENRNVLKPVERTDDPESPENNSETNPEDEKDKINGDKNGVDDLKKVDNDDENKPTSNGEKTEYAEMINQRPSSTTMTSLSKAPTEMSGATAFSPAPQPQFGHPPVALEPQVGPVRPQDLGGMVISPQLIQNGAAPMTVQPPPPVPVQPSASTGFKLLLELMIFKYHCVTTFIL